MALSWQRDDYVLELTEQEKQKVKQLRAQIQGPSSGVIRFNTGCSKLFPYKKRIERLGFRYLATFRGGGLSVSAGQRSSLPEAVYSDPSTKQAL